MISYRELQEKMRGSALPSLAILPVGCYEQHGPVLPLDTDNIIAETAAKRLAERLKSDYLCHVFPTLTYTTTEPNRNYTGTVSIEADPFRGYLRSICRGILESEFKNLVIVNSHGSIVGSLKEIAFELVMQQYRDKVRPVRPVLALNVFDFDRIIVEQLEQAVGRHADWKEFLLLWDVLGQEYFNDTRMRRLRDFRDAHSFEDKMPKVIGIPAEHRTTDGVQGQPLPNANEYAELARQVWEITLSGLTETVTSELTDFEKSYAQPSQ